MGSAVERTSLADVKWDALEAKIEVHLGAFIKEKATTPQEVAMMAEIVGPAVVQKHVPEHTKVDPLTLEPVFMLPEVRMSLRRIIEQDLALHMRGVLGKDSVQKTEEYTSFKDNVKLVFDAAVRERQTMLYKHQPDDPAAQADEVMGEALAQLLKEAPLEEVPCVRSRGQAGEP